MSNVTVSAGSLTLGSQSLPLDQVLGVETKPTASLLFNAWYFITGCFGPIAAMVIFTVMQHQPAQMWTLGLLTAAGPFIAIVTALLIRKPWGVVIETPTAYRCVFASGDKAQADAITEQIRKAIAA